MRIAAWCVAGALMASGCAARVFTPPAGPSEPFTNAAIVWQDVTAACRDAQRYVAEVRVQGRVGSERISSTFKGALTRHDDVFLELQAFGTTWFQMAGQQGTSTFVLPRDRRVLRAPTAEIVAALTGLRWGGRELLDVFTGCATTVTGDVTGARVGNALRVDLSASSRAWLRERSGAWTLEAAQIADWVIEYRQFDGRWPREVRVTSSAGMPLDLRFTLTQLSVNIDLPSETFTLTVPNDFVPMTLDELRSIGPLRERQ